MKYVIDRKTWRRPGKGRGDTQLENKLGYKCCLGFICEQSGIPNILNVDVPSDLLKPDREKVNWITHKVETSFIEANDSYLISDNIREEQIKELAAEHGHEIEFIN